MNPRQPGLVLILATASMLGGCTPAPGVRNIEADSHMPKGASEQLLDSKGGPLCIVEEESGSDDPLQAHMTARAQVNPSPQSNERAYTSMPTTQDLNEPMHFRVLKLERQMAGLQEDFNKLLPPLENLATNDDQLDLTLNQIKQHQQAAAAQHITEYEHVAAPLPGGVQVAPPPPMNHMAQDAIAEGMTPIPPSVLASISPATPAAMPAVKINKPAASDKVAPPPVNGVASVTRVRTGMHPGNKVRIVLDLSAAGTTFKADIDNTEKLLTVELPDTAWTAEVQKNLKTGLVKGYTTRKNSAGTGMTLVIELSGPARLALATAMKPVDSYGNRIVLDVAPL